MELDRPRGHSGGHCSAMRICRCCRENRNQRGNAMSVETTIDFLSAALRAMRLESGRSGKHGPFAERLVRWGSAPALGAALEHLLPGVDASTDVIHPPLAARMMAVACGPDGPRILRWWRERAKLVTLIA